MQVNYEPWAITNEKGDLWGVKLLDGEFAGAVISINSIEMADDTTGEAALDFNFIQTPPGKTEEELTSPEFNEALSSVVNDILTKAMNDFKDRDSNPTESVKR